MRTNPTRTFDLAGMAAMPGWMLICRRITDLAHELSVDAPHPDLPFPSSLGPPEMWPRDLVFMLNVAGAYQMAAGADAARAPAKERARFVGA